MKVLSRLEKVIKKILRWILTGVLPILLYLVIYGVIIKKSFGLDSDIIKASIAFSFIPYFALQHFFKLFKELFVMWREGNWLIKIIIPLGLLSVFGRAAWLTGWR